MPFAKRHAVSGRSFGQTANLRKRGESGRNRDANRCERAEKILSSIRRLIDKLLYDESCCKIAMGEKESGKKKRVAFERIRAAAAWKRVCRKRRICIVNFSELGVPPFKIRLGARVYLASGKSTYESKRSSGATVERR